MKSTCKPLTSFVVSGAVPPETLSFDKIVCSEASEALHDLTLDELAAVTNTFSGVNEGLSLLPNRTNRETHNHLHLLVHGSKGGEIHSSLISAVDQLKRYKNRSVSIEALTQGDPPQVEIGKKSILLVPLFLLPGTHVLTDVPKIFNRFKEDGQNIKLFPFIGSFQPWLSLIGDWISNQSSFDKPALIHHPVSSETSSVFLKSLENTLDIPLYSWSRWNQDILYSEKNYFPIPYFLTPNKNVEIDSKGKQLKSLLEVEMIQRGLVNILGNLP
tara:strand:+ start:204 stop:1019 length:816 start_codon:yes stop_codon:yes gene_type:complete